jgi:fructokinase
MMNSRRDSSPSKAGKKPLETRTILFGEMLADVFPDRSVPGGAPFNVARHLAAFGETPLMVSRLGDDALGRRMLGDMKAWGMDTSAIQIDPNLPTGQVRVHMEQTGHSFEILPRQAYDFIDQDAAALALDSTRPGLVYFGTLSQRHQVSRQALAVLLRRSPAPRFLDINLREPWYDEDTLRFSLGHADIVKLNDDELRILADMFEADGTSEAQRAGALARMFDIGRLIVTCGDRGAWQLDGEGNVDSAPADTKPAIVDTVGAGDAFAALCILGMTLGWQAATALQRAERFAAAICEIRGAVPEDQKFYEPFLKEWEL